MPVIVLPPTPAGMQTLPPGDVAPQPEIPPTPLPTVPEVPEAVQPPEPAVDLPVHRIPKQDRN